MTPTWLSAYQNLVESTIANFFDNRESPRGDTQEQRFDEALRYAVEGGGKRLRPILAMVAYEVVTGQTEEFWNTSNGGDLLRGIIGIEFIHCYTLVHDDLPSMDNDILRRGKSTVWKHYGESMALLVGDALQTIGFELVASTGNARGVNILARALGDMGVVRGQVRDTLLPHNTLTLDELLRIHDEKTGGFIAACLMLGAELGGATEDARKQLYELGMLLGRAFQVKDDLLDVEASVDTLGKTPGKDAHTDKGIISLIGIDASHTLLSDMEQALNTLAEAIDNEKINDIVQFVIRRAS